MLFPLLLTLALAAGDGEQVEDFEGAGSESWERLATDAHPPYNTVERVHDPEQAKSGNQFLHFRTLGGSTGVRRSARDPWPAEPGRPYQASVWVRLSGTKRNAAVLSLTWVGAAGEVVGEQRSAPLSKTEGWTRIVLEVPRSPAGVTGVLPGLHFEGGDIRGLCDFDVLELTPVERLELRPAGRSTAIYTTEEYPRFTITPEGVPPGTHAVTVTMTGPDGREVRRTATIDLPGARSVAIDFPPSPAGLYQVRASIDGTETSKSLLALVTPPGFLSSETPESGRFIQDQSSLDADGQPTASYFARKIIDQVLVGAEPIADPGFFPADVQVAAFRKGASIVLVLWSDKQVDVAVPFADARVLQPDRVVARDLRPGERLRITPMPQALLDVDPLLTELRLELSTPRLPLQLSPSRLTLGLRNRSQVGSPRDLTVTLDEIPAGWRASNRRFRVATLAPAAVHEETLDLIVPPTETERPVDLKFTLTFTLQGRELSLQIVKPMMLQSPIRIESTITPAKLLSIRVVNTTDHAMTLSLRSRVPGLAERLELIRDLGAGSKSKAFEFPVTGPGTAEIYAQEAGGDRAVSRRLLPLP